MSVASRPHSRSSEYASAIRTYSTDSGPHLALSRRRGMVRANSKPGCQTKPEAYLLPSSLREKGWG